MESQDPINLQIHIFDRVKEVYELGDCGLVYDVTNTYFYGKKCPLAKYGKDKEGVKGRPLIQIGLCVTKEKGVPVVHRVFDGNIHDSKTFRDMLTDLPKFEFKKGFIVFDRGISSKKNQLEISSLKWEVICGLPLNPVLKRFLDPFMSKNEFLQYKNRVRLKKTIFYAIARPYSVAEVPGKLVMCFNEQQRKDLRESRYDEIHNAEQLLQQGKTIKQGLERYFDASCNVILQEVDKAEKYDGYSMIFTTAKLAKDQVVKMYFDKDLVEKAFQSLKGVTRLRPIRHWLYNRVTAHVFICYLSYLLLTLMQIKLEDLHITSPEALKELGTMYRVHMHDARKYFTITKVVTLTKKQETILKAIDPKLLKEVEEKATEE